MSATAVPISEHEDASRRLYKAHGICVQNISTPKSTDSHISTEQIVGAYVRCIASNMGLWTDATGYQAKRVAKFFIKKHSESEVMTVVDYCNQKHQQMNLDLWAYEAYRCATAGRMGIWLREYMLSAKLWENSKFVHIHIPYICWYYICLAIKYNYFFFTIKSYLLHFNNCICIYNCVKNNKYFSFI